MLFDHTITIIFMLHLNFRILHDTCLRLFFFVVFSLFEWPYPLPPDKVKENMEEIKSEVGNISEKLQTIENSREELPDEGKLFYSTILRALRKKRGWIAPFFSVSPECTLLIVLNDSVKLVQW